MGLPGLILYSTQIIVKSYVFHNRLTWRLSGPLIDKFWWFVDSLWYLGMLHVFVCCYLQDVRFLQALVSFLAFLFQGYKPILENEDCTPPSRQLQSELQTHWCGESTTSCPRLCCRNDHLSTTFGNRMMRIKRGITAGYRKTFIIHVFCNKTM